MNMIDAHIHLDHYSDKEISNIIEDSQQIEALLSVSFDVKSCERNLYLSKKYSKVKPAFGFHPEQSLPADVEKSILLDWMSNHLDEMTAIGEVGLPYYLRQEGSFCKYESYVELLEEFVRSAKKWDKPIVLHAVYDDAPVVCKLLEKYSISKAHFHWFKGDSKTVRWMSENGYFISVTPDVVYEEEIQKLVNNYPLEQIMVETDGPWPFKGAFAGKMTHPNMMEESLKMISGIKGLPAIAVAEKILQNTKGFYQIF